MKILLKSRAFPFFLLFFLTFTSLIAQDYSLALGGRFGSERGVTLKYRSSENLATEGMLVHHQGGALLIGLVDFQFELGRHTDSYLFFGAGGHMGYRDLLHPEKSPLPMAGVDATLGFEYVFPRAPIVFSVDMKPQLELLRGFQPSLNHAAVTLRYILY